MVNLTPKKAVQHFSSSDISQIHDFSDPASAFPLSSLLFLSKRSFTQKKLYNISSPLIFLKSMISLIRSVPFLFPLSKRSSPHSVPMAASSSSSPISTSQQRRLPILLFDVMDTIVRDPFYHHIPAFFEFVSFFY
jgi:hypothetical protein